MANTVIPAPTSSNVLNVPNVLTAIRFLLAIVVFVLVPFGQYVAAIVVFLLAASTDWIDGYWARKYGQVTKLGRIFDPFVDKIIICGTFIFLAAEQGSGITAWMAVVVMGRELLVTALRSFIEQEGGDFSAQMSGKLKMVFQCIAVVASLIVLRRLQIIGNRTAVLPPWLYWTLHISVWVAVLSTVQSGLEYIVAAARMLGSRGTPNA